MELYTSFNRNYNFSFPHQDADRRSTEELLSHYCRRDYFAAYCLLSINPACDINTALNTLRENTAVAQLAAAWMRLKFLCEVLDPIGLLKKRNARWKLPEPLTPLLTMSPQQITEETHRAEVLVNHVGIALHTILVAVAKANPVPVQNEQLLARAEHINTQIHAIRRDPLDGCMWDRFAPQELVPFAWATYVMEAFRILRLNDNLN